MLSKIMSYFFLVGLVVGAYPTMAKEQNNNAKEESQRWQAAGYRQSEIASKDLPGYRSLKRVLLAFAPPAMLAALKAQQPDIKFELANSELSKDSEPFDAVWLSCGYDDVLAKAGDVAWIQSYSAGVEGCLNHPTVAARVAAGKPMIITNGSGAAASVIGEHAIAMMMSFTRGLHRFRDEQNQQRWSRDLLNQGNITSTVAGKTMLVLGLGSIGKEVAKRADALGMRVIATRNRSRSGPEYIDYVGLSDETLELAKQADVIVNALPLTASTAGLLGKDFFEAMQPSALLVSVGRGGTTDTAALLQALESGSIAGAALDVTDPEPLPADHPLWKLKNVIITPHLAGTGGESRSKVFALVVENMRRYQAGEPLLNQVDVGLGY